VGALAGLVAALALILVQALARLGLGVSPPTELIGDRVAPLLGIERFFSLLELFGGYDQLKALGVGSATLGQLGVGVVLGAAFAWVSRRPGGDGDLGEASARRPLFVLVIVVAGLWLVSVVALWPVLATSYRGLPPSPARAVTVVTMLVSSALFIAVLWGSHRLIVGRSGAAAGAAAGDGSVTRRAVVAGGVGAGLAVATGGVGVALFKRSTFGYDGMQVGGPGILPITPNDRFYVVTKNVIDPRVQESQWQLSIGGLVDRPHTYAFDDLRSMTAVTQETTLSCISNPVGGGLQSNAMWTGVPLADLLAEAGPEKGVVEVLVTSVDGYSDSFSIDKAMERSTLVAYEMNDEPLPQRHGYPARILVPGLFGEKSVKWVTRIELVDFDAKGFYEQQGWGPEFVVPTRARFTEPDLSQPIAVGAMTVLRGTAFAGDRGVTAVEVSTDGAKTWNTAELEYSSSPLAWVLWRYDWLPERAGEVPLAVRAIDGTGEVQTAEVRDVAPGGATGHHRVVVRIQA
jgi:DMSO/TMAO reductase YedYZ molybdopterin-dependent catalytic subunit